MTPTAERTRAASGVGLRRLVGVVRADASGVGPLDRVVHGGLAALLAPHDEEAPLRESMRAHTDDVERVFAGTDLLPSRFGVLVEPDVDVVEALLEPGHDALVTSLDQLAGHVEVLVRVEQDDDQAVREAARRDSTILSSRSAIDDLDDAAAYAARVQLGERVVARVSEIGAEDASTVLDELGSCAVSVRGEAAVRPGVLVEASYLVPRDGFDRFDAAVGRITEQLGPRARVTAVGPLPPYSFADLGG